MPATPPSITSFITDGSLAQLCQTIEGLLGAPVALRDRVGRFIAVGDPGVQSDAGARDFGGFTAPIRINGEAIGSLALGLGEDPARQESAERFLSLLASIVSELCQREVELNQQIDRMAALQKIASTLVGAGGLQDTIDIGLQTAIELLNADAGTLRLLDPSGRVLLPRAAFGLSQAYLDEAGPLPADNALDREILSGAVVAMTEFPQDERVRRPQAVRAENLSSMLSAALIFHNEPLGVLRVYTRERREFTEAERELFRSIARQIAAAVANARLLEREARSTAMREQVRLAGEVQRRMLPSRLPDAPPLSFGAICQSSYDVGGDFYDLFHRDGQIGMVVGDVVGKGVAAALLMANLLGALRAFTDRDETPADVLAATNRALCRDSLQSEFATVFLGFVDPASGRLLYCNGGHEPPLVVRVPEHRAPTRADVDELDVGGMVVGVDPSQRYQTGVCDLGPGDVMLAFSDGVTEAMNYDLRKYTRERVRSELLTYLGEHPRATARSIAKHTLWAVRRFTGLAEQSDDITIVAMRVGRA